MKTLLLCTILAAGNLFSFSSYAVTQKILSEIRPEELTEVHILCQTNKSPLSYKPGEEMVYTFTLDTGKDKPGNWKFHYSRRGDDNKSFNGYAPVDKPLVIKTSLDKPGFVNVKVSLVDSKGKIVQMEITRPNKTKYKRNIYSPCGTAVLPETLTDCGEPADFDAFWAKQKKRLATVPFMGKVEKKLVKETRNGYVYSISIPCAGPRPATGYLTIPKNAKIKSLPIHVHFYGYGATKQGMPGSVTRNQISLFVNAHGQKLGETDEYYKKFFQSIRTPKYDYAFDPEENKNPETAFFNGMALRNLRAIEYAKTLPEWNGKDLIVRGASQGGLQTMWAAALDPDVTEAYPAITWCCDIAGTKKKQRVSGAGRIQYAPGLDYYDSVFMAKRIKKAKVVITRAGLGDYVCPPSGLAICYRNLATPDKTIHWYQGSDHGFIPQKKEIITWTAERIIWQDKFSESRTMEEAGFKKVKTLESDNFELKDGVLEMTFGERKPNKGTQYQLMLPAVPRGEFSFEAKLAVSGLKDFKDASLLIRVGPHHTFFRKHVWVLHRPKHGDMLPHVPVTMNQWVKFKILFDANTGITEYYVNDMTTPVRVDFEGEANHKPISLMIANYALFNGTVKHQLRNMKLTVLPPVEKKLSGLMRFRGVSFYPDSFAAGFGEKDIETWDLTFYRANIRATNRYKMNPENLPWRGIPKYIVMEDMPLTKMSKLDQKNIVRAVKSGSTLIILGGLYTLNKGDFAKSYLEEILPVDVQNPWAIKRFKTPIQTPFGPIHNIHDLKLLPDSEVLMTGSGSVPLIVRKNVEKGSVIVFLGIESGRNIWDYRKLNETLKKYLK